MLRHSLFCFLLLISSGFVHAATDRAPPNIVVIVADDLGAQDLGTYGHPSVKTPNINALAQRGLQFNQAFLTTASCTASRASLLTGLYPQSTGAASLHQTLPASRKLISHYLRTAGYYTASIGKWHLGNATLDQFDAVQEPPGDSGAETWITALRARPKNKPFFFWLASRDPHVPYAPLPADTPYKPEDAVILPAMLDTPGSRLNILQYYQEVTRLDQYVGQVLAELETQGVQDNTVVVFLSDNGAPMPRAKTTLYDAGIRTPLIMAGPGIVSGEHSQALISSIDLMPTLLTLATLPVPSQLQGQSFVSLLQHPDGRHRDRIFAEQFDHGFHINKRAVRDEHHLLIRNIGDNKTNCLLEVQPMGKELSTAFSQGTLNATQALCFDRKPPPEELYDVQRDPYNLHNLARNPKMTSTLNALRQQLDAQASRLGDTQH